MRGPASLPDIIVLSAPEIQRIEMRRAFSASAVTILQFTEAIANIPDDFAGIHQSMHAHDRLHAEKRAFVAEMGRLAREPK
jgi:hypothetical protein